MQVLVVAASRHNATREIAAAVGQRLAVHGLRVVVVDAEAVTDLDGYDAVVLGSALRRKVTSETGRRSPPGLT